MGPACTVLPNSKYVLPTKHGKGCADATNLFLESARSTPRNAFEGPPQACTIIYIYSCGDSAARTCCSQLFVLQAEHSAHMIPRRMYDST